MDRKQLQQRTKKFHVDVIRLLTRQLRQIKGLNEFIFIITSRGVMPSYQTSDINKTDILCIYKEETEY